MNIFRLLIPSVILFCLSGFLVEQTLGQTPKKTSKKKPTTGSAVARDPIIFTAVDAAEPFKSEPYLSLEPCAKETETQITELENAPDLGTQLTKLLRRAEDNDEWTRACAIYRLGEFRKAAQDALPLIIKLLRDESNKGVWAHVEDALWKIPPDASLTLEQRIRLTKDPDVYRRLYAIYTLGYFRPVPHSFQARDTVKALVEATADDDPTVRWLAVMAIRQLGFYGVDISSATPALSDLLLSKRINPIHVVRAFVPMGEQALSAAPLLLEVLFNPKKYVIGDDDDNVQSSSLYLTVAIALGRIGPSLIPILEKESEKRPFPVMKVLSNLSHDKSLNLLLRLAESSDPKVRKAAVSGLPGLTSIGALQAVPILLKLIDDGDKDVADAAISRIGTIGQFTQDKSPELLNLIRGTVVPKLITKLRSKNDCLVMMSLGRLAEDAKAALPAIVKISRAGSYCADVALYYYGPVGRKYLSQEKLADQENQHKPGGVFDYSFPGSKKPKPIKPKTETPVKKITTNDG